MKMHEIDYAGRSKWMDRSIEEECWGKVQADGDRRGHVFMCCLVRLVLYDEWELKGDKQEQTVV